jgi:hypothetical protein
VCGVRALKEKSATKEMGAVCGLELSKKRARQHFSCVYEEKEKEIERR